MARYTQKLNKESDIVLLYGKLGWSDYLGLSEDELVRAMSNSFYVVYVYEGEKLIGTGRVVSDGIINAYICGIGVLPEYRKKGIGKEITNKLCAYCKSKELHVQLVCEDDMVSMYKKLGFKRLGTALQLEEGD